VVRHRLERPLEWQELAVSKARELEIDKGYIEAIVENYGTMKKGEPTWPTDAK
jgi:hypothetical protein